MGSSTPTARRWLSWLAVTYSPFAGANALIAALDDAAISTTTAVILGAAVVVHRRNAPIALEAMADVELEPDLGPMAPRDTSARRRRRQRQFGSVAIAAALLFPIAETLAKLLNTDALWVVALSGLAIAAIAFLGYGWAPPGSTATNSQPSRRTTARPDRGCSTASPRTGGGCQRDAVESNTCSNHPWRPCVVTSPVTGALPWLSSATRR